MEKTSAIRPLAVVIAVLIVAGISCVAPSAAHAADCSPDAIRLGTCVTAQTTTNEVQLGGSVTSPGITDGVPEFTGPGASLPYECEYIVGDRCLADIDHSVGGAVQPITLADIAGFRPQPGLDRMQPNGWAVIGLDTNFFAETSAHVVDGTLLGQPASVRFTPVGYNWSYGDGTARATTTAGTAWSREFDPTPTSHVYEQHGTFVVDLSIEYSAEYRFAGLPWLPIAGILTLPAPPLTVTVGDAKTLLVARDCGQKPRGPGC